MEHSHHNSLYLGSWQITGQETPLHSHCLLGGTLTFDGHDAFHGTALQFLGETLHLRSGFFIHIETSVTNDLWCDAKNDALSWRLGRASWRQRARRRIAREQ